MVLGIILLTQSLQDDVQGLNSQLDYVDGILQGLDDGESGLPVAQVREFENAKQKQAELQHQIQELLRDMEAGTQIVDQFQVCRLILISYLEFTEC